MRRLLIPAVVLILLVAAAFVAMSRPTTPPVVTITATANPTLGHLLIITYRPDGSSVNLPLKLTNNKTNQQYNIQSGQVVDAPDGVYNLTIDLLEPYTVNNLSLTAGQLTQLPITLSEIRFPAADKGTPVPYAGLNVHSADKTEHVALETPVLLSPGNWPLTVARDDKPDAFQPAPVSLAPGQRRDIILQDNLFGSGTIEVDAFDPDGKPLQSTVGIYPADKEDGAPITSIQTNTVSQLLPQGDYVLHIGLATIAVRREQKLANGDHIKLTIQTGRLQVTYRDAKGTPQTPSVYIVSTDEMKRLQLPIDQVNQKSPYGILIPSGRTIIVAEGAYSVMATGQKDTLQDGVQVTAGKTTSVELKGSK